jgi:hypothetical protein
VPQANGRPQNAYMRLASPSSYSQKSRKTMSREFSAPICVQYGQVKSGLAQAKQNNCDDAMARLMLRHGRLTDEARRYLAENYQS